MKSSFTTHIALLVTIAASGCGQSATDETSTDSSPDVMAAPAELQAGPMTAAELRAALGANENAKFQKVGGEIVEAYLLDSGVKDISALKGLSLRALDLGRCPVEDISALAGMPLKNVILEDTNVKDISALADMQLEVVYLQNTQVADISVLKGMPIKQLNLMGTKVTNLDAIQGMPLEILWVPETPLSDISGVADSSMISLDIRGTQVTDLTPIAGMTNLERLNIVDCNVKDVTPLAKLNLQRLLFTPANIETGMETLRSMPTLKQLGIDGINVQSALSAQQFWSVYDDGGFRPKTADDASEANEKPADEAPENTDAPSFDSPDADDDTKDPRSGPPQNDADDSSNEDTSDTSSNEPSAAPNDGQQQEK